jgi:hypothetical protein
LEQTVPLVIGVKKIIKNDKERKEKEKEKPARCPKGTASLAKT